MLVSLIDIGNSKGIRLPSALIKQFGFGELVEMKIQPEGILIEPVASPREGWEAAFQNMRQNNDDLLLDDIQDHSWDENEWVW
jgi:antitoxin MazE